MIYFDNASTTPLSSLAKDAVNLMMDKYYANPSSLHSLGFEVEKKLDEARENIAKAIKASPEEIYFTSGGTEANNTAILGAAETYKRNGNKVITMPIEHPSVLQSFKELENRGFEVLYAPIDNKGYIILEELEKLIDENVILVSIMHVNNETATIQNIAEIGSLIKKINPKTIFHVDNVQGFGKHRLGLKNIDLMSMSSHKIHGAKGCGALYIKNGVRVKSLILGGAQQNAVRPGTENTMGIYAMGVACKAAYENIDKNLEIVKEVKNTLYNELKDLEGVYVNGDFENGSPYILSLSFEGLRGEVLLHSLEDREIYVSTGSACSTKAKKHLSVIDFLDNTKTEGTVRFSFSSMNTVQEAKETAQAIKEIVPMLRLYKRR